MHYNRQGHLGWYTRRTNHVSCSIPGAVEARQVLSMQLCMLHLAVPAVKSTDQDKGQTMLEESEQGILQKMPMCNKQHHMLPQAKQAVLTDRVGMSMPGGLGQGREAGSVAG